MIMTGSYGADPPACAVAMLEDGLRQEIQFFDKQDAPVTAGLLIDSSGSMASARERVIAAATTFAETSNSMDEIFALTFSDGVRAVLPSGEPFTSSPDALRAALTGALSARGRTALYDAISEGLAYAAHGTHERKVLVVVSDGGDNASARTTFDTALRLAQVSDTAIYTVGLTDPLEPDANPKRLKALSEASGGEAFLPSDAAHVEETLRRIASDIRSAYTLGYVSTNKARDGRFRQVRVLAHAP